MRCKSRNMLKGKQFCLCMMAAALAWWGWLPQYQSCAAEPPAEEHVRQEVRPLPGSTDDIEVFNSNSPEVARTEGILLSTFPNAGMKVPGAHLNQTLSGRFDFFLHHVASATHGNDLTTLYLGLLLHNSSKKTVTVKVLRVASYLSQPDAPFITLPPFLPNDDGKIFSGPGDRVMDDVLRGKHQEGWPNEVVIPSGKSIMLMNLPIPVAELVPSINGRSTLIQVESDGPLYAASMAMFARKNLDRSERGPTLDEWEELLHNGDLAGPRDVKPTPPGDKGKFAYGRVSGISRGSEWKAQVTKGSKAAFRLAIPPSGQEVSYVIDSVEHGTFGTGQIQSAPMVVRYDDTAYRANGNYGLKYDLTFPLFNESNKLQTVTLSLQTPIKSDSSSQGLGFYQSPAGKVFFRGTVRLSYHDDQGVAQTKYIHLVQNHGQRSEPLVSVCLSSREIRPVRIEFLYPPDATPPQVLTVKTLDE